MSNDIINMPVDATDEMKCAHVLADEVWASLEVGLSASPRFTKRAGLDLVGKRVIGFAKVYEGGGRRPGSGTFVGWKKTGGDYVVTGCGKSWTTDGEVLCYYYVKSSV